MPAPFPEQMCTFQVGELQLGLPVQRIQEVLRAQPLTPVPGSGPTVAGLLNLRGVIVTAVDLHNRLAVTAVTSAADRMQVVTQAGGVITSLLVDRVGDIVNLDSSHIEPVPSNLPEPLRSAAAAVVKTDAELMVLLDLDKVLGGAGAGPGTAGWSRQERVHG